MFCVCLIPLDPISDISLLVFFLLAIFLAKISKGRTVREFILGTIMAPSLYCFIWIILYGGVALRLERESSEIGLCCKDDSGWFRNFEDLSNFIDQNSMQDNVVV